MKLSKLLEDRGMSPAHLARETGLSETTISNYRRKKTPTPLSNLLRVARVLRVSLDYLADDARDEPDPEPPELIRKVMEAIDYLGPEVAYKRLMKVERRPTRHRRPAGPAIAIPKPGGTSGGNADDPQPALPDRDRRKPRPE